MAGQTVVIKKHFLKEHIFKEHLQKPESPDWKLHLLDKDSAWAMCRTMHKTGQINLCC